MGSEQQQHSERCAERAVECAERVEWLTLRAVCPGNGIDDHRLKQIQDGISRKKVHISGNSG